jgi:hypothetical protein
MKMVEVLYREVRARQGQNVDVAPSRADHIKEFLDTQIRISPTVTFVTGQPLKLNRSLDLIIYQNRSRGIVNTGVNCENDLGH